MARVCAMCAKGSYMTVKRKLLRGHYNPTAKKRKHANLQWAILASGQRAEICTKCLKTLHKVAA